MVNKKTDQGLSIFHKLLIAFLSVVIIVSGLLIAIFYVFSKKFYYRHAKEDITQQFNNIYRHFKHELGEDLIKDLRMLADSPLLDEFLMSSKIEQEITARALERLFIQYINYDPSYQAIYFVDLNGQEWVNVTRKGRSKNYHNISRSPLFVELESGSKGPIIFQEPTMDKEENVYFSTGIYKLDPDIGEFGGMVVIEYNLEKLISYLAAVKKYSENLFWVITPSGQIIKKPNTREVLSDPQAYLLKKPQKKPLVRINHGSLTVYQDLFLIPGKPLIRLAVSIPSSLIFKDIDSILRFLLIIFLLSILMAGALAFFLSQYLTQPIVQLAAAASTLAKGDLSSRVKASSTGEVQMLINSFNQMADDLKKTTVSKDYLDNVIMSMINTLVVASPEGEIIRCNEATKKLLGFKEEELVGKSMKLILEAEHLDKGCRLDHLFSKGPDNTIEKIYLAKDKRKIPVLFSASKIKNINGKIQGIVCVAQDISDLKQAQKALTEKNTELEKINKELNQFAYIVSHDLKAPLRAIANLSQWIEEDISDILPDETHEQMDLLRSRVRRMEAFINGILEYSRIGRAEVELEMVDTKVLIAEIIDSLSIPAGFSIHVPSQMPSLKAPRIRLYQVFSNLISNAVKHSDRSDGRVELSVKNGGKLYEFSVTDNGPGIAPQYHERIFIIFQTLTNRDTNENTGVGLTLVKKIVEEQGGSISVESKEGHGAVFTFTWPKTTIKDHVVCGAIV